MTVPVVRFVTRGQDQPEKYLPLNRDYTVVYDGTCKVCTKLAAVLQKWDNGMLEVVPSQTPGVQERFPWIPAAAYLEALQMIGADGTTWQGSDAIEQLLTVLPRGKLIGWVFHIPYFRTFADRFYRWFARNRYSLGCGKHCALKHSDLELLDHVK
jgi:predicted DCC family thiol-disulfide oxidoreductase YuxK